MQEKTIHHFRILLVYDDLSLKAPHITIEIAGEEIGELAFKTFDSKLKLDDFLLALNSIINAQDTVGLSPEAKRLRKKIEEELQITSGNVNDHEICLGFENYWLAEQLSFKDFPTYLKKECDYLIWLSLQNASLELSKNTESLTIKALETKISEKNSQIERLLQSQDELLSANLKLNNLYNTANIEREDAMAGRREQAENLSGAELFWKAMQAFVKLILTPVRCVGQQFSGTQNTQRLN